MRLTEPQQNLLDAMARYKELMLKNQTPSKTKEYKMTIKMTKFDLNHCADEEYKGIPGGKMGTQYLNCVFNMPPARKEKESGLPPYRQRRAYLVDDYPACPNNWMSSEGSMKSYFVPVEEGSGMWLDFNGCDSKYHIAIVPSVQGINPITGMPCEDFFLEQYNVKCPKHDEKFGPDRYCKSCGYKWPKQNYISSAATRSGELWIDGFRTIEGIVEQYVLTSDKIKGVANNVVGEDRVFSIGLAFFLSKNPLPAPQGSFLRGFSHKSHVLDNSVKTSGISTYGTSYTIHGIGSSTLDLIGGESIGDVVTAVDIPDDINFISISDSEKGSQCSAPLNTRSISKIETKSLEVGHGAKIDQKINDDTYKLDHYREEPESLICINYVTEEDCEKIIDKGKKEMVENEQGFLNGVASAN